ncbi:RNA polymerase sigma factor [candidate division KSB1 bacterium]
MTGIRKNAENVFYKEVAKNFQFLSLLAKKYMINEDDARDLVQDTLFKALKNKDKFRPNTNIRGWLTTIMRNTFINKYHKEYKKKHEFDIEDVNLPGIDMKDPVLHSVNRPGFRAVKEQFSDAYNLCLKSLPPDFQTLIVLCDVEGFSYSQMAEYLHCPIGTVRTRLYRGRKRMVSSYKNMVLEGQI